VSDLSRSVARGLARVALVALGLLAAELGWRVVLVLRGKPYEADATAELVRNELEAMGAARRGSDLTTPDAETTNDFLHPFIGFETREGHEATSWQVEFARRSEREGTADDAPFTVLVVGGSEARIFASPGENGGVGELVAALERELPELSGRVVVLDHGREAHKQPQQATLLVYLFSLGLHPDAVVNIDGFNEAGIGMYNAEKGLHPVFPSQPIWAQLVASASPTFSGSPEWEEGVLARIRARRIATGFEEYGLYRSAVLGSGVQNYVRGLGVEWRETVGELTRSSASRGLPPVSRGPDFPSAEDEVLELIVTDWVESSRCMNALCAGRGIAYLHVLQPTLFDENSKPLTEVERAEAVAPPAVARGVRLGYPSFRRALPELRADGVAVLDASGLFRDVEDRIYYDLCHFNRPGTALLGEAIGRALADEIRASAARTRPGRKSE
jgi:hypothetical protein